MEDKSITTFMTSTLLPPELKISDISTDRQVKVLPEAKNNTSVNQRRLLITTISWQPERIQRKYWRAVSWIRENQYGTLNTALWESLLSWLLCDSVWWCSSPPWQRVYNRYPAFHYQYKKQMRKCFIYKLAEQTADPYTAEKNIRSSSQLAFCQVCGRHVTSLLTNHSASEVSYIWSELKQIKTTQL